MKKEITAEVYWCDKNYSAGWAYKDFGAVIATAKTIDELKQEFESALDFQIETMVTDGDSIPNWLMNKDYTIKYDLQASAILRNAEKYTTMAAISRVTGINQRLLSNYASDVKRPRPKQLKKIIAGIHEIGRQCLAL